MPRPNQWDEAQLHGSTQIARRSAPLFSPVTRGRRGTFAGLSGHAPAPGRYPACGSINAVAAFPHSLWMKLCVPPDFPVNAFGDLP